ncbi:MAG TPA: hypothetical protein PLS46_07255 [Microthrixaceae bacterium]|nr:hypothetical protein [Microthrixaceae bacterium]
MPLRQRIRPVSIAAIALVSGVLLVGGCGGDDTADGADPTTTAAAKPTSTTSAPTTTSSTTTTVADGGAGSTTTAAVGVTTTAGGSDAASADAVPDGTSFGYVTAINIGGSTVTIDIAELLTGDAAVTAAIEDGALEPGETSIDNDYYVRNKNPKLRTVTVGPTAPVNVLSSPGSPDLESGNLQKLAEALTAVPVGDPAEGGPRLPVQIVARGGLISRIDEVFFP